MSKYLKKYLILILCFLIAIFPIFSILLQFDVISSSLSKIIFFSIVGGAFIIYLGIMSYLIFKKGGK